MATVAEVQAELDAGATGLKAVILKTIEPTASITEYYVRGGVGPLHTRWASCTTSDDASTQAASILTQIS